MDTNTEKDQVTLENDVRLEQTPGIVYLSRIPPGMNPKKIRGIFQQFGDVGRLFLQPEDELHRKKRKKNGGSNRKQFTEGWIEFKDKKVAKGVARTLNNTTIGGKKRYYYHDDIWNIKYLPKFKWGHISEKLAYEKAAREQRMRTEISQAKREAAFYLENVHKGQAVEAIKKKRARKRPMEKDEELPAGLESVTQKYHQKSIVPLVSSQPDGSGSHALLSTELLSKVFGS